MSMLYSTPLFHHPHFVSGVHFSNESDVSVTSYYFVSTQSLRPSGLKFRMKRIHTGTRVVNLKTLSQRKRYFPSMISTMSQDNS